MQYVYFTKLPLKFWFHKGLSARSEHYVTDGVYLSEEGLRKYSISAELYHEIYTGYLRG